MALNISTLRGAKEAEEMASKMIMKERIWLTADGARAVPEGHPEAATLLAAAGRGITAEVAARYGIRAGRPPAPAPERSPAPALTAEDKARAEAEAIAQADADATAQAQGTALPPELAAAAARAAAPGHDQQMPEGNASHHHTDHLADADAKAQADADAKAQADADAKAKAAKPAATKAAKPAAPKAATKARKE